MKNTFHTRTRCILFISLISITILSACITLFDFWLQKNVIVPLTNHTVQESNYNNDFNFHAYLSKPKAGKGPFPVIILIHDFIELTEQTKKQADKLASHGYLVIAPSIYGNFNNKLLTSAITANMIHQSMNQLNIDNTIQKIVAWTKQNNNAQENMIGLVGIGYGGTQTLSYTNRYKATVSVSLNSKLPPNSNNITTPTLCISDKKNPLMLKNTILQYNKTLNSIKFNNSSTTASWKKIVDFIDTYMKHTKLKTVTQQ